MADVAFQQRSVARGASARKQGVPFGPFLATGGLAGLLYGPAIIDWYGRLSGLG